MKSKAQIEEMLYIKKSFVHGQVGKLTDEQEHDLKMQIHMLEWVLSKNESELKEKINNLLVKGSGAEPRKRENPNFDRESRKMFP